MKIIANNSNETIQNAFQNKKDKSTVQEQPDLLKNSQPITAPVQQQSPIEGSLLNKTIDQLLLRFNGTMNRNIKLQELESEVFSEETELTDFSNQNKLDFDVKKCDRKLLPPLDEAAVRKNILEVDNGGIPDVQNDSIADSVSNHIIVSTSNTRNPIPAFAEPEGQLDNSELSYKQAQISSISIPNTEPNLENLLQQIIKLENELDNAYLQSSKLISTLRVIKSQFGDFIDKYPDEQKKTYNQIANQYKKSIGQKINIIGQALQLIEKCINLSESSATLDQNIKLDIVSKLKKLALEFSDIKISNVADQNQKLKKSEKISVLSSGISLVPAIYQNANMCPYSTKACRFGCLADSGQGEQFSGTLMGISTNFTRQRRALLFLRNRSTFTDLVSKAIENKYKKSKKDGFNHFGMRMNVLSDLPWESLKDWKNDQGERVSVFEKFPDVQFYDYTKNPLRMIKYIESSKKGGWPPNYSLTFSLSELNMIYAIWALANGGNIAVPFDVPSNKEGSSNYNLLPKKMMNFPVIDGDLFDSRFLDKQFFTKDIIIGNNNGQMKLQPDIEQRGIMTPEDVNYLRESVLGQGSGMVVGLRLKGRKYKKEVEKNKKAERAKGLPFGTLTDGFVMYADDLGLSSTDYKTYNDQSNQSNNIEWIVSMIEHSMRKKSEQMKTEKGFASTQINDQERQVYSQVINILMTKYPHGSNLIREKLSGPGNLYGFNM